MNITGTQQMPPPVQAMFDKELLRVANPFLHHGRVAKKRSLKRRSGNTIIFRRVEKLPLALAALAEGQPPSGATLTYSNVQATIQQYGNFTPITDMVDNTVQHKVSRDAMDRLGENMGETMDALDRDVWVGGTSIFYGGGAANRGSLTTTTHKIDANVLNQINRYLNEQNAKWFNKMVDGNSDEGTLPQRQSFWAIITPGIFFSLDSSVPGFSSVETYAGKVKTVEGEVGMYKNIRFLMSTQGKRYLGGGGSATGDVKSTGGLADVHVALFFGMDAVAEVPLEGASMSMIVKPLGSAGAADPLDQIMTIGWKHESARVRLDESFMTRLECTVGDVAP